MAQLENRGCATEGLQISAQMRAFEALRYHCRCVGDSTTETLARLACQSFNGAADAHCCDDRTITAKDSCRNRRDPGLAFLDTFNPGWASLLKLFRTHCVGGDQNASGRTNAKG